MTEPPVPEGYPHELDDSTLKQVTGTLAARLREAIPPETIGYSHEGVLLGYEALLEVGRGEQVRRQLLQSERLSRRALRVAIGAALVTSLLAIASVGIALRDPTPDRIEEVRDRLPADAGARELELLNAINTLVEEQVRTAQDAAATLNAIRQELRRSTSP
jgi:voltage-gated potassium channel Kch